MDRWLSQAVVLKGGIHQELDALTQGTTMPGSAAILQNYEPSTAGGYRRINGYTKWDAATVPGDANSPILGVSAWLSGTVYAARYSTSALSNDIYKSSGSGWTKINTSTRPGNTVTKMRMLNYSMTTPAIIFTDGVNYAAKYDGTTYTVINGTGAPTNPKYAEFFNNTIALSGYGAGTANGCKVVISAPITDTDFDGAHGAIEFNVGDQVVGLRKFRDVLYIFCQNSIWSLSGTDTTTYAIAAVTNSVGCISGDTVQEVGGDLMFLAQDGLRSLAATYRIGDLQLGLLSRPINQLLLDNSFLSGANQDNYISIHVHSKNQYRAWLYVSSASKTDAFGIIGRRNDDSSNISYDWSTTKGVQPYCAHSEYNSNQEIAVIGDPTNGYVYRLESGNDFDGTPIAYIYRTPDMTFNDTALRKVVQKLELFTQAEGNISISLNVILDSQIVGTIQPAAIPLYFSSSSALYGSGVYGTSAYAALQYPLFKLPMVGSGFMIAFEFSGSDSNPPHRLDSFNVEFAQKARR